MRAAIISATLLLTFAGSAFAQEYVEFKSMQDRFSIVFPAQPKITDTDLHLRVQVCAAGTRLQRGPEAKPFQSDRRRLQQHPGDCGREGEGVPAGSRGVFRQHWSEQFDRCGLLEARHRRCGHSRHVGVDATA